MHQGVDLHTHTNYSDGLDTPAQLVAKAAHEQVLSLAITDHDSIAAFPEAQQAGTEYGVEILAGVELTVQYEAYRDIHVLGYGFDIHHADLQACLVRIQAHRVQRGIEILARINARLSQRGQAPLNQERVLQRARGAVTRPHLAQELMAQRYATSFEQAFQNFLIPCDVVKASLSPEEAFALIAQAGGVCSLAHPATISTDPNELERLIVTFKAMGLVGLEVYHHRHYPEYIDFFLRCAWRHDLVATGGSDYHGHAHGASLGHMAVNKAIPAGVLVDLQKACSARGIGLTPRKQLC